jgi:hypothetical protein
MGLAECLFEHVCPPQITSRPAGEPYVLSRAPSGQGTDRATDNESWLDAIYWLAAARVLSSNESPECPTHGGSDHCSSPTVAIVGGDQ